MGITVAEFYASVYVWREGSTEDLSQIYHKIALAAPFTIW